jgi:hypothetical protein
MYEAKLDTLGITIKMSDDQYKTLQEKEVVDDQTGEELYKAKIINVDPDSILLIKETKFKRVEE